MNTDFQNLLNRFKDFPVIERRPSFLEIAGFPSRETVWRNIFAFFFNPNECHGFKDLFLRSFFDALGKDERYWVDQKTPAHVSLNQGLREVEAVSKPARFTLSQPIEEIVADIEKTLLSMIAFLAEKQAAQAPQ